MIDRVKQVFSAFQDFIVNLTYSILHKTGLDVFYQKYPKRFFTVLSIILVALFLSVTVYGKVFIKKAVIPQREIYNFDLDQDLLPPAEPLFREEYYLSREQKEKWSDEDIQEWFTIPNEYMIEKLHDDNTRLIQGIMEGSP
ncbi:MAG TPA: hypothetical protein PK505_02065 [Treponemataceae bacterium]|nr:hypothetical protein [Treponemataceae bacterium]HQC26332.1 hypothetical protein [Treponemataceae bacterium]